MIISDDITLSEIQEAFHEKFPYLKIEFFKTPHQPGEGSPASDLLDHNLKIGAVRTVHNNGELSINGHLKARSLEAHFSEMYGLNVQVFRLRNKVWIQTINLDDHTLADLNRDAEAFTNSFKEETE